MNLSRSPDGRPNIVVPVGDYNNPILKPQAAEQVKRMGEISRSGIIFPDPFNQCWPQPMPYILWQLRIQLLQEEDQITILSMFDHQVRRVRMNASHPAQVTPTWHGDSVGHYEDDTLVVDTVGVKVGPLSMVDLLGTPYSEALHVVERYRLIDYEVAKQAAERAERENGRIGVGGVDPDYKGKGLQVEFTVEDEGVFTQPWSASVTYRRAVSGRWEEYICAEDRHNYITGRDTPVPTADNPDF